MSDFNNINEKKIIVDNLKVKCCGGKYPFDHPHIYLTLEKHGEALCPYCGTKYLLNKA